MCSTLSTESAFWWINRGSSHPTQKSPVYSLVSGKSPVFPDEVGRTSVSIREIASFSGQGWSEGFLRSAQPLRSEGHGICRMVRRWPSTTLFTEWDFWWTNRSFSNASEMRQSSNPNRQTMIQIGTRCSRRDDLWSHRLQLKLTYC